MFPQPSFYSSLSLAFLICSFCLFLSEQIHFNIKPYFNLIKSLPKHSILIQGTKIASPGFALLAKTRSGETLNKLRHHKQVVVDAVEEADFPFDPFEQEALGLV